MIDLRNHRVIAGHRVICVQDQRCTPSKVQNSVCRHMQDQVRDCVVLDQHRKLVLVLATYFAHLPPSKVPVNPYDHIPEVGSVQDSLGYYMCPSVWLLLAQWDHKLSEERGLGKDRSKHYMTGARHGKVDWGQGEEVAGRRRGRSKGD